MTTAWDLRKVVSTPNAENVNIEVDDNINYYDDTVEVIFGDVQLLVTHKTTMDRDGLASTDVLKIELYLDKRRNDSLLVPFTLPADLDCRMINVIEEYFEVRLRIGIHDRAVESAIDSRRDYLESRGTAA